MPYQIQPCLWFDGQAGEAADFYTSIFPDGKIIKTDYYTKAGHEHHGKKPGDVLMVTFTINNTIFQALNGGPQYKFTPATSFTVLCDTQKEVDHYWARFGEGGKEVACGWIEDKFGVSWQIVPKQMEEWVSGGGEKAERALTAMMVMVKLDIEGLKAAYEGEAENK